MSPDARVKSILVRPAVALDRASAARAVMVFAEGEAEAARALAEHFGYGS